MKPLPPLLALLLAVPLLAGCIGYPPEAARPGDTVQVRYVAHDLATGERVSAGNASVVVGGASGLGTAVGRALVGHRANDTLTVEARGDPGLSFSGVVSVARELGRRPITEEVPAQAFRQVIGEPTVGLRFDYPNRAYDAEVTAVGNETVSIVLRLPADPRTPYPQFGLAVASSIEGGELVDRLEPLAERPPFAGPLVGLLEDSGTYRARGMDGGNMTFDFSPVLDPQLVGRDVRLEVTIVSVEHGVVAAPKPGEYGHRLSPQLGS